MSVDCPLCGSRIEDIPISVMPERGMVVCDDKFVIMPRSEMMVLTLLIDAFPNVVSKETIMTALYGLIPDDEPEIKIVDVFICKLRARLKVVGVRIDTTWGRGYALAGDFAPRVVGAA